MNRTNEVKAKWDATFADYVSISDLRTAVRRAPQFNPCVGGFRSVCWKAFLLYQNIERNTWSKVTRDSRDAYSSLKEHLLRDLKASEGAASVDPLADEANSPWQTMKEDEALRVEILQDVERCMPEIPLFRQPEIREMLLNILFVYCKINADLGYRQGMHELLAPFVWVLHQDSSSSKGAELKSKDGLIAEILDMNYVEHDAFSLFCIIMQTAKAFYETAAPTRSPGASAGESPIVERSKRIHEEYLSKTDPELATHLTSIDILPQIFVIRWIRLLFGREFPFDNVLGLWDMVFAEDPALTLVDHICVAMLLRIRWQLVAADYSTALTLLLRYPEPRNAQETAALVADAVYLNNHMDLQGGSSIIRKYTNRVPLAALAQAGGELVKRRGAHTPQSSLDMNRNFRPLRTPAEYIHNQGGLEAILQGAAKNVYTKSEQWGLNKAIRGAVQNFQNNTLSPPKQSPGGTRWSLDEGRAVPNSATGLKDELNSLQKRNKQLAKMLAESIDELSKQSKSLEEKQDDPSATALALSVARLQYLQVHLADSQLPLDSDSPSDSRDDRPSTPERSVPTSARLNRSPPASPTPLPGSRSHSRPSARPTSTTSRLTHGPAKSPPSIDIIPATTRPAPVSVSGISAADSVSKNAERSSSPALSSVSPSSSPPPQKNTAQAGNFSQPRPSLAESSYSWMLGDGQTSKDDAASGNKSDAALGTASAFTDSKTLSPEREREDQARRKSATRSKAGFLFGDGDAGGGDGGGGGGANTAGSIGGGGSGVAGLLGDLLGNDAGGRRRSGEMSRRSDSRGTSSSRMASRRRNGGSREIDDGFTMGVLKGAGDGSSNGGGGAGGPL